MEKKNEKTVQSNEMEELTLDQMDKVSAGGVPELMGFWDGESEDKDVPWTQH